MYVKEIGHLSASAKYPRGRPRINCLPRPPANLHFRRATNNLSRSRLLCRDAREPRVGSEKKRNWVGGRWKIIRTTRGCKSPRGRLNQLRIGRFRTGTIEDFSSSLCRIILKSNNSGKIEAKCRNFYFQLSNRTIVRLCSLVSCKIVILMNEYNVDKSRMEESIFLNIWFDT